MTIVLDLDAVIALYAAHGGQRYGEGVTQLEHAVQCAALAEAGGGSAAMIAAALLHDIGHLLVDPEDASDFCVDDRHEAAGARVLATLFGKAVSEPVALHVAAKRYLRAREPGYLSSLSGASRKSLALQGGPFDRAGADAFERLPHWREAVELRRIDDRGKRDDAPHRCFADFIPMMRGLAIDPA